jgi:hypothetical protein
VSRCYAIPWRAVIDNAKAVSVNTQPRKNVLPNGQLIHSIGFTAPPDVGAFIERLRRRGLALFNGGHFIDIAVVDEFARSRWH